MFNKANFTPVGNASSTTERIGSTLANYEVTGLTGTNTSRVLQIVTRFNW